MACASFAGVVEFTKAMSPTTIVRQLVDVMMGDGGGDDRGKTFI